jgi:hypothetical protein
VRFNLKPSVVKNSSEVRVEVEVEIEKYTNPILYSKNYFLFSFHKRWEDSWAWVEFVSKYWEREIFSYCLQSKYFLGV